jgi:hypothetical protein
MDELKLALFNGSLRIVFSIVCVNATLLIIRTAAIKMARKLSRFMVFSFPEMK